MFRKKVLAQSRSMHYRSKPLGLNDLILFQINKYYIICTWICRSLHDSDVEFFLLLKFQHSHCILQFKKTQIHHQCHFFSFHLYWNNQIIVVWYLSNGIYLPIIIQWEELMFKMAARWHCTFCIEFFIYKRSLSIPLTCRVGTVLPVINATLPFSPASLT